MIGEPRSLLTRLRAGLHAFRAGIDTKPETPPTALTARNLSDLLRALPEDVTVTYSCRFTHTRAATVSARRMREILRSLPEEIVIEVHAAKARRGA
jgi:hypothetical protein